MKRQHYAYLILYLSPDGITMMRSAFNRRVALRFRRSVRGGLWRLPVTMFNRGPWDSRTFIACGEHVRGCGSGIPANGGTL